MTFSHVSKHNRAAAKKKRRLKKRAERERRKNAKEMTDKYGTLSIGPCGRKNRYRNERIARSYAIKYGISSGKDISYYHCKLCDGWHLTSHPKKNGGMPLKASDVLDRSRSAARRMRQIDAELQELGDRIGPQGHSYERAPKNDIRDPMRHVDEKLDGTVELERERAELMLDILEAQRLIWGFGRLDEREDATLDSEYVMTEYYVYGRSIKEISARTGVQEYLTRMLLKECVKYCDEVGIAKLRKADDIND